MYYTLKQNFVYRVPTVEDALRLRKHLEKTCIGELTSFTYTSKCTKKQGEILDEWQVVKATITVDNEKEPEGVMPVEITEE